MSAYKREQVLTAVKNIFQKEDFFKVTEILNTYGTESHEGERERVQLAILKLSEGNLKTLLEYTCKAKQDYRDIVYWAEYTKEDKQIENPYGIFFEPTRIS